MEQQQIKAGDTVRRVRNGNGPGYAQLGQLATVLRVCEGWVYVTYEGMDLVRNGPGGEMWLLSRTELVKSLKTPRIVPGSQSAVLLSIFRAHPSGLTPSYVHTQTQWRGRRWPLTSVRARITKLADAGLLVKEDATKPGIYGKPEHVWRIA